MTLSVFSVKKVREKSSLKSNEAFSFSRKSDPMRTGFVQDASTKTNKVRTKRSLLYNAI
jgi:hypothetical protein